ncbi:hypothetical protein ALO_11649 [Acetonema longum DSM 6540]|uniref:Uncharacterized protein n=1 Tax=Acetonema longum DSM 6540 TaxID=1009370 RepID=F7NJS2_9FIRM|nr:hypothetical protein ALO_11649 [Acetonema longum DSM 6540]
MVTIMTYFFIKCINFFDYLDAFRLSPAEGHDQLAA